MVASVSASVKTTSLFIPPALRGVSINRSAILTLSLPDAVTKPTRRKRAPACKQDHFSLEKNKAIAYDEIAFLGGNVQTQEGEAYT